MLALLQQARIDHLIADLGVQFLRALAFHDDAGDAGEVVPNGEIGDDRLPWQRERVAALQRAGAMTAEDLPDAHARVAVIHANIDRHLIQRQDRGVGLRLVGGQQHARVAPQGPRARRQQH